MPIPIPAAPTQSQPQPQLQHHQAPHLSPPSDTLSAREPVVHSPRPVLSPKRASPTFGATEYPPASKSERVEELERMAEEGGRELVLLLESGGGGEKGGLPSPPLSVSPTIAGVNTNGHRPAPAPAPVPANKAPPTPMLTAITPIGPGSQAKNQNQNQNPKKKKNDRTENGLDALERRLLAEVGTRKEKDRADAGGRGGGGGRRARDASRRGVGVLPIAIPSPALEPLNDSAISSLTLADHDHDHDHDHDRERDADSDERTHQPGKRSPSLLAVYDRDGDRDRDRDKHARRRKGTPAGKEKEGGERRGGKKKERARDGGEAHRRRKSAKGRVAAWLGGIDPEIPPPMDNTSPLFLPAVTSAGPSNKVETAPAETYQDTSKEPAADVVGPEEDTSAAPHPRSSGFVPIGTLKDQEERRSGIIERSRYKAAESNDIGLPTKGNHLVSLPSDLNHSPPPPNGQAEINSCKPLPAFPPAPDPAAKYDIRSARGGRGGRVAAVASIWASQAGENEPTPAVEKVRKPAAKPVKTPPKASPAFAAPDASLADLTARRARLIKSQSAPAAVSSSHAKPMLSSTASLARSIPLPDRRKTPIKLPPTISESQPDISHPVPRTAAVGSPQSTAGDLAFGQARLRDLIKKYQGQTAS
jgi:hypothetical protein